MRIVGIVEMGADGTFETIEADVQDYRSGLDSMREGLDENQRLLSIQVNR